MPTKIQNTFFLTLINKADILLEIKKKLKNSAWLRSDRNKSGTGKRMEPTQEPTIVPWRLNSQRSDCDNITDCQLFITLVPRHRGCPQKESYSDGAEAAPDN